MMESPKKSEIIELADPPNPEEESKEPLNPQREQQPHHTPTHKLTSIYQVTTALRRTQTFAQKFRSLSTEHHPAKAPCSFFGAVFGLCCTGAALGLGLCCCAALLLLLEIIPIAAIVVGATYWNTARYCPAENLPLLLVIGGTLKVFHLTLTAVAGKDRPNAAKYVEIAKEKRKTMRAGKDVEGGGGGTKDKDDIALEKEMEEVRIVRGNAGGGAWGDSPIFRTIHTFLTLAEIIWFITATVIVYGMWSTVSYEPESTINYCSKGLYRFSFWYVTFFYILLGLGILVPLTICCCGLCSLGCAARRTN